VLVTPVIPSGDLVTPSGDLVTPSGDLVTPSGDLATQVARVHAQHKKDYKFCLHVAMHDWY
jgi:hypothetical protein